MREPAEDLQGIRRRDLFEELRVDLLDDGDRARSEAPAPPSDAQPQSAGVRAVDLTLDQALPFQTAQHLRGHLDVGARKCGECGLRGALTLLIQPPGAGQKHELYVGEIERSERLGDATLPTQRRMPEQESGALARVKHQRSARSTASAIRSSIGSCPCGAIVIVLPAANGPDSSARSRSAFQSGHPATSAQRPHMASRAAVVSMLCSVVHMASRLPQIVSTQIIFVQTIEGALPLSTPFVGLNPGGPIAS